MEGCRMNQTPRILIFTGDGKGKTTAALGMAFRASGHGLRTCAIQFIKSDASVGEVLAAAAADNIEVHPLGLGFISEAGDPGLERHRAAAQAALRAAAEAIAGGRFAIVILDEICLAVARGLIDEREVADLLSKAPAEMCLVLTGRDASPGLIALADTVTEMRSIKHGLQVGRTAQQGVER
jgi:cob(I)alamin adenosyltransferase